MKGQGTDKIFARLRFVISRFFFIYFTVTEVKKIVRYSENFVIEIRCRVILLQIVMVRPGTHRVPVRSQWVPVKKKTSWKVKMLGSLCKQTVNL